MLIALALAACLFIIGLCSLYLQMAKTPAEICPSCGDLTEITDRSVFRCTCGHMWNAGEADPMAEEILRYQQDNPPCNPMRGSGK